MDIRIAGEVSSNPRDELRSVILFAVLAVVALALLGGGFFWDVGALKGLGGLCAAASVIGAGGSLWMWHQARVLGPMTIRFVDARESATEPGIDCVVAFERTRPESVSATLAIGRWAKTESGSSARSHLESHYGETMALEPDPAEPGCYRARFPVHPTNELPPSGPFRGDDPLAGNEIRWSFDLEVVLRGSRHRLPYFVRAT